MRAGRLQAILLAFVLALIVCLTTLLWEPASVEAPEIPEAVVQDMVTDMHVRTLAALALANDHGSVAMIVGEDGVEIIDAPAGAIMPDTASMSFLYRMAHMPAEKTLGMVDDLTEYGLDEYEAAVVLLHADGSRERLFLGDEAPFGAGWYLMRESDRALYLVDELTATMMRYSMDDFRELNLFPAFSSQGFASLSLLSIVRGGERLTLTGQKQGEAVYFTLHEPFEAALNWQQVVSELAAPLASLRAQRVVSDAGDFETYGLLGESACALMAQIDGQQTVLLFAPKDEETFYCANAGQKTIVTVAADSVGFLTCDALSLMDESLYSRKPADVDSVAVRAKGVHTVLRMTGEGVLLRGEYEGRLLSQAQTVSLYKGLTQLPIASVLSGEETLSGEPMLSLSIALKDGVVDQLELLPVSARQCAVVINGEASFTTYTTAVQQIARTAAQQADMAD